MNTQKTSHSDKQSPSLRKIFKESFKKVPPLIFPSLIIIFICSVLVSVILTFGFSASFWYLNQLASQYNIIQIALQADPNYIIPPELQSVYRIYPIFFILTNFVRWAGPFFILFMLILLQTGRMHEYFTHEIDTSSTWPKSIKFPFRSRVSVLTSIFLIIGGTFFVTFGFILFILPGMILVCFWIFALFSFLVDEKNIRESFRGARFYLSNHWKILIIVFFSSIFVPLIVSSFYQQPLMNLLNLTDEHFIEWLDPANRQWGFIFLYHWISILCQTILFWWFPALFASAFFQIRDLKLDEYAKSHLVK